MHDEHRVSRRASLKGLGAMGAAMVLGGPASAQVPSDAKPAKATQDKPAINVVDLAADRFAKGHA